MLVSDVLSETVGQLYSPALNPLANLGKKVSLSETIEAIFRKASPNSYSQSSSDPRQALEHAAQFSNTAESALGALRDLRGELGDIESRVYSSLRGDKGECRASLNADIDRKVVVLKDAEAELEAIGNNLLKDSPETKVNKGVMDSVVSLREQLEGIRSSESPVDALRGIQRLKTEFAARQREMGRVIKEARGQSIQSLRSELRLSMSSALTNPSENIAQDLYSLHYSGVRQASEFINGLIAARVFDQRA
ncbi:MAG: hypothetical protein HQL31_01895 [Planctomycetes bacterium]|nr:hypothetical protein [Planctomycetota bacterium]